MSTKIVLTRVDKRLLHATVALNWNQFISVDFVAVVSSEYNNDPFIESVMQLCLPKSMRVKMLSPDTFLDFIKEGEADKQNTRKVMVLFSDLTTACECVKRGFYVKEIQLPYPASRLAIRTLSDYFSKDDIERIRFIQGQNIKLFFQTTPFDAKDYGSFYK